LDTGSHERQACIQGFSIIEEKTMTEWYVAGFVLLLGAVDAFVSHIGLRSVPIDKISPFWLHFHRRSTLPYGIAAVAGGQFSLSLVMFLVWGAAGQYGHLALMLVMPLTSAFSIYRAGKRA
jgi:hypothetical protein